MNGFDRIQLSLRERPQNCQQVLMRALLHYGFHQYLAERMRNRTTEWISTREGAEELGKDKYKGMHVLLADCQVVGFGPTLTDAYRMARESGEMGWSPQDAMLMLVADIIYEY